MRALIQAIQELSDSERFDMARHDLANPWWQKGLKERGIDSMVADARESTPETDAEHLRR